LEPDFWLDRWRREMIGFHQSETNRYLQKYIDDLALTPGDTIFVPLCGKSLDMWWLYEQGFNVIGIEISDIAARSFFTEAGKKACKIQHGAFVSWKYAGIEILCGDFFKLNTDILGRIDAIYDRAALIALPVKMREKYVDHLGRLVQSGTRGLLVTLEYPQEEMAGPPFSVSEQEVEDLFTSGFNIELMEDHDALDENLRFRDRGLTRFHEKAFRFRKL